MVLKMHILNQETKEVMFDTATLVDFSDEQLLVLAQQIGWEIEKRNEE